MSVLSIKNVGKAYRSYASEWHRFAGWFGLRSRPAVENWVLRHINFDIGPGEAIGIVGKNGAGKSTLLKIITGTLQASEGSVSINGRIAAILELGMGFNAELSGRQNVRYTAGLMGLSVDEIDRAMPEIEAFAEISDYFDEPMRTYSTGMQVRVAFAVATAYRPEVLIIDEALSVGDAGFGRKCFQRIEEFQDAGTTLLFVSHDTESVKKLCDRAIFLKQGELVSIGSAKSVCDAYEKDLFGGIQTVKSPALQGDSHDLSKKEPMLDPSLVASCEVAYGSGKADIDYVWIEDLSGNRINIVESGEPFRWCYRVSFHATVENPIYAMMLKTREGIALYGVDSTGFGATDPASEGDALDVVFQVNNSLAPGEYYLNSGVRMDSPESIEFLARRVDAGILRVVSSSKSTIMVGLMEMGAELSIRRFLETTTGQQ